MFTKVWSDLVFFHLSLQIHDPLFFCSSPRSQVLWLNHSFPELLVFSWVLSMAAQQCSQEGEVMALLLDSPLLGHHRLSVSPNQRLLLYFKVIHDMQLSLISWHLRVTTVVPLICQDHCTCLCDFLPLWFSFIHDFFITFFMTISFGCPVCGDHDKYSAHGLDSYQTRLSIWLHPRLNTT